ncbi:bZIP transcription factor 46 [Glycine soja]
MSKKTRKATRLRSLANRPVRAEISVVHEDLTTRKGDKEGEDDKDVLIAAIGRPEHPDHAHAAGVGVTIKQYFGPASRSSHMSTFMAPEDLEKLTQKIRNQLEESFTKKELALPLEPEVGPSATRVSMKGSCVDPSGQDPDTGDSEKCGLYVDENPPHLVALGRVYEGSTTIHNVPLGNDQVKVDVEEVQDVNADRSDPNVDPLYLMTLTIPQLFLKPMKPFDFKSFGNETGGGGGRLSGNFSLTRQPLVHSLTFDEFMNNMGGSGKDFGSMNMDELLKNIWTTKEVQTMASARVCTDDGGVGASHLQCLGGPNLAAQMQRQPTLREMTLEEFLVNTGVVREDVKPKDGVLVDLSRVGNKNSDLGLGFQQMYKVTAAATSLMAAQMPQGMVRGGVVGLGGGDQGLSVQGAS